MTETAKDRLDAIRARANAATEGPWQRHTEYGPNFFANIGGPYLQGVGDFNFGEGDQAEADEALVANAQSDIRWLLAYADSAVQTGRAQQDYIDQLKQQSENAQKLVDGWKQASEEHARYAQSKVMNEHPGMADKQEGRSDQLADCANELADVLNGENPDEWAYGIGLNVTEASDRDG